VPEQFRTWLVETDPDKSIGLLEGLADSPDFKVFTSEAVGVGYAIDNRAHDQARY